MIRRLVAALDATDLEIDAEAIADGLWLARAQGADPLAGGPQPAAPSRSVPTEPRPPDAEPHDPADDILADDGGEENPGTIKSGDAGGPRPGAQASTIMLAEAPALPGALELGRALRPMKLRHPSKRRHVLDANATIRYFCDTNVLTPVMRTGAEHWFDIDVFVDVGPSMAVWQDTAAEFVVMLQRHGAFRTVRRWNLEHDEGTVRVSRVPGLRSTAARLADPGARRLVVVLTDGIGPLWYQAPVWEAIREWGLSCPVVLMSPLPPRLWPGTALGTPEVRLRSHRPGTANQLLEVTLPWWWPDDEPPRSTIPVPVLTLDAAEVAAWARMTMGVGGAETVGVFAMPPPGRAVQPVSAPRDAEELVERFRVSVSPVAGRLAVYLSAVLSSRWDVGVARIVQEAAPLESGHVHLAEILIGGLVRQAEPTADQQEPMFEFIEGVADVLRRSLTGTEALRLLQALSGYIERATGHGSGIAALLVGEETAAPTGAYADLRTGAANLISVMSLARAAAPPEPPRPIQSSVVRLTRRMLDEEAEAGPPPREDPDVPAMPDAPPEGMALLAVHGVSSGYNFQFFSRQRLFVGETPADLAPNLARVSRAIDAGIARSQVSAVGRALWRDVIPSQIRDAFWATRDEIATMTITAEASPLPGEGDPRSLPWELLYPYDSRQDEGFLVEQFPVTRVIVAPGRPAANRITLDRMTFVSSEDPPGAQAEAEILRQTPGLAGMETWTVSDLSSLVSLIDSGRAGSLHISSHVTTRDSDEAGIAVGSDWFRPLHLPREGRTRTQSGSGPLVFVSQHETAREEPVVRYRLIENLGRQVIYAGAAAFVANAWAVSDRGAFTFAQAFYESLAGGEPLGKAAFRARQITRNSVPDDSWLAYVVVGSPEARVVAPSPEPSESRETSQSRTGARRRTASARVVAVHGLGQQMQGPQKLRRQWLPALQDGLEAAGADPLKSDGELAVAFYGDLFRPPAVTEPSTPPEEDSSLEKEDAALAQELLPMWRAAAAEQGTSEEQETTSKRGSPSRITAAIRFLLSSQFFGDLTERMLIGDLKQIRRYLTEPGIRYAARERLAAAIRPETRVIVAHSLGSIVAYEALCAHPEWEVPMLVTLGSPLGANFVFDRLQPPPDDGLGSWPGSIRQWINIADSDDFMAAKRLTGLFAGPVSDVQTDNGARARDVTSYLRSSTTGRAIADGLNG